MVAAARVGEVDALVASVTRWARERADVRALALVGSWARGVARDDSDVDLVLLTGSPASYVERDGWVTEIGGLRPVGTHGWGAIIARRFALPSGVEIEFGIGRPAWASIDPLDAGTRQVVTDGMRPLYDPDRLLAKLHHTAHAR